MYLYEKQNDNINIYLLEPDKTNTAKYRKLLMQGKIDNSMYNALTGLTNSNKILEYKDEVSVKELNQKTTFMEPFPFVNLCINKFHSFKISQPKLPILDNYYNGFYEGERLVKVYDEENATVNEIEDLIQNMNFKGIGVEGLINNRTYVSSYKPKRQVIQYLLITQKYVNSYIPDTLKMDNIISIPEELYMLETFINGDLSKLDNMDDHILNLFLFYSNPIITINMNYLKQIINYGIVENNLEKIEEKINSSEKILKKLK